MFRKLTDTLFVSPQISLDQVDAARAMGVVAIVNNRPDGESGDQVSGADIARKAEALGMRYHAIPVTQGGFSEPQVKAMGDALMQADGPVLAFCRSGTRSTLLWALTAASAGTDPDVIAAQAADAGYDIAPIRAIMDMLATRQA